MEIVDANSRIGIRSEYIVKAINRQPQDHRAQDKDKYQLIGTEFFHRIIPPSEFRLQALSSPKAVCSTLTASSVYFSSMMHEIRISEVLIKMILMFSAARVLNILEATPE